MSNSKDCVKVAVRCRPMNSVETSNKNIKTLSMDERAGLIKLLNPKASNEPPKKYTFDSVFDDDSKQMDVYNKMARPIVESVLEGYNGTVFAYGQTGTGKTFSMEGMRDNPDLQGIMPNAFSHIFQNIDVSTEKKYLVCASYLEIYQEEIRDLLSKNGEKKLELKERPDVGVYVKDLSAVVVQNAKGIEQVLKVGQKNRHTGSTNMNEHSSRSHAIFTITIECQEKKSDGHEHIHSGKLHLVDLAGSERQAKTGASGQRLKEATKINQSLSCLGNVIAALVDGSSHVPYRDSRLTRMLQDSLGGNAKTMMLANIGPADYNYDETLNTLRYANRAKNIKNKPIINEDPKDAMLRKFQEEIDRLKEALGQGGEGGTETESGTETDSEESDEQTEEYIDEHGETRTRRVSKKKHSKKSKTSSANMEKIQREQARIEIERNRLHDDAEMAEGEKKKAAHRLDKRQEALEKEMTAKIAVSNELKALESKLLVGGENILDKHERQQMELDRQQMELEKKRQEERRLQMEIEAKQEQQVNIEEKYSSLKEEAELKTKKLKKLWAMLQQHKGEIDDMQAEFQHEREGMLENVRNLTHDLKKRMLIVDNFIPPEEQERLESMATFNDDLDEWQIKHIAHAGNNVRAVRSSLTDGGLQREMYNVGGTDDDRIYRFQDNIYENLYLSYDNAEKRTSNTGEGKIKKRDSRSKKNRPTTARKNKSGRSSSLTTTDDQARYPSARGIVQETPRYV